MASIVIAADERYLPCVPCTLAQLSRFGRRADGVTLVITAGAVGADLARVTAVASADGLALDVVAISDTEYPSHIDFGPLRIAECLPHLDDVVYLDGNTLICGPLDDLLLWELRHPIGAVPELGGNGIHLFGSARVPYFNAGVLRMSLERMRREQTWDQAVGVLAEHPLLPRPNQDVLNLLFADRFDSLPLAFNVPESHAERYPELALMQDPLIVRFSESPWRRSATSSFAREWRRQDAAAGLLAGAAIEASDASTPVPPSRVRPMGMRDVARKVLPPRVKRPVKAVALRALDRTLCQLEEVRTAIRVGPSIQLEMTPVRNGSKARDETAGCLAEDRGLDLLVSIERSGTNALGRAIREGRPDVHFLSEVYAGHADVVRDAELIDRFPWFADRDPAKLKDLSPAQRGSADRVFAATMSAHAVDFTHAVLANRQGRTLVKIFPQHLHSESLEQVLRVFRPRLLFLRRDNIFTYVSRLRAVSTRSWINSDQTDVPYAIHDREACSYIARCDAWFEAMADAAAELQLDCASVTYDGLFNTGSDVEVLNAFYPGAPMPIDPKTGRLEVGLTVQDRRTDASVLGMIAAATALSPATQAGLLRSPGNSVDWQSVTRKITLRPTDPGGVSH